MIKTLLALGLLFLAPGLAGAAAPSAPVEEKMSHFEVAGLRLTIPDAYRDDLDQAIYKDMTGKVRVLRPREPGGIGLVMVYPTLRSYAPQEYAKPSRQLQLIDSVRIDIKSTPLDEHFWTGEMRKLIEKDWCSADEFMDACPHWSTTRLPGWEDEESLYLGNDVDFTYCNIKLRPHENPSCKLGYVLVDGISIDIGFNRRFLDDVLGLRQRIFDLVCSWIDLPAGRTYRVNRCR